jgi:hypothetical protein
MPDPRGQTVSQGDQSFGGQMTGATKYYLAQALNAMANAAPLGINAQVPSMIDAGLSPLGGLGNVIGGQLGYNPRQRELLAQILEGAAPIPSGEAAESGVNRALRMWQERGGAPHEFSGNLDLYHMSSHPSLHHTGFEDVAPEEAEPHRYGGSVFGDKSIYLDETGKWVKGDVGFDRDNVYHVNAPFKRAFVLSPQTIRRFKELVPNVFEGTVQAGPFEGMFRGTRDSDLVVNALKKHGYDGLIVRGFDQTHVNAMTRGGREAKLPEPSDAQWMGPEGDAWRKQNMKFNKRNDASIRRQGIPMFYQQDQIVHFKPGNVNVRRKMPGPFRDLRPPIELEGQ